MSSYPAESHARRADGICRQRYSRVGRTSISSIFVHLMINGTGLVQYHFILGELLRLILALFMLKSFVAS